MLRPEAGQAFLFRDHIGIRPLAYSIMSGVLHFSTDIVGLCISISDDYNIDRNIYPVILSSLITEKPRIKGFTSFLQDTTLRLAMAVTGLISIGFLRESQRTGISHMTGCCLTWTHCYVMRQIYVVTDVLLPELM